MTQYLLVAEVDKIQDFIFRSSSLREVVGGSQLLSRFCEEVPDYLLSSKFQLLINKGGSFRILFERYEDAKACGEELAQIYYLTTGGTMTVIEPVEINDDFIRKNEEAEKKLREAKRQTKDWVSQEQFPYMAFCASCGIGLAVAYFSYHQDKTSQYYCTSCLNKSAERIEEGGVFLQSFYNHVVDGENLSDYDWPGRRVRPDRKKREQLEDVADYNDRRYVAYLVADGNSMGEVFGQCNKEQITSLSDKLTNVIHKALAKPTKLLMENHPHPKFANFIPALPLILGGDDVFALIPAPFALDFAKHFCQEYEKEMRSVLTELEIKNVPDPTISAAIVICKSKHPYSQAHDVGQIILKEAKRLGKKRMLEDKESHSTISFEVLLGGGLFSNNFDLNVRSTLAPYWITGEEVSEWGLPIQRLLYQRRELDVIPRKRLSQLQDLYDIESLHQYSTKDRMKIWSTNLDQLIERITERNNKQGELLNKALKSLGDKENDGYWYRVLRLGEEMWYGHGLPDLLRIWDYSLEIEGSSVSHGGDGND